MDEQKAKIFAFQIAKLVGGRSEKFPQGEIALGASYRVRASLNEMRLHIHVGDGVQTIWVQNFDLQEPFLKLAVAINEPDGASALVEQADVGLEIPAYINTYLYCDAMLARVFCLKNREAIESLRLAVGERLCVQRCQIRLRLVTEQLIRVRQCLAELERIFDQQGGLQ
jgi:hypothetical protein